MITHGDLDHECRMKKCEASKTLEKLGVRTVQPSPFAIQAVCTKMCILDMLRSLEVSV